MEHYNFVNPLTIIDAIVFCFDAKETTHCDTSGQAFLVLIAFSITILISALVLHLQTQLMRRIKEKK